ncbi:AraC-like ligand-binding domain-containing protein [Streptomyces sp. NPDC003691]
MIETVFRGDVLPVRDRFDSWRELVRTSHAPVDVWSDHSDDFSATFRLLDLGPVRITEFTCPSVRSNRTARHIRQGDPEGEEHAGRSAARAPGTASRQPHRSVIPHPGGPRFRARRPAAAGPRPVAAPIAQRRAPGVLRSPFPLHL